MNSILDQLDGDEAQRAFQEGGIYLARLDSNNEPMEETFVPFQGGIVRYPDVLTLHTDFPERDYKLSRPERIGDIVMIQPDGSKKIISQEQLDGVIKAKCVEALPKSTPDVSIFEFGLVSALDTLRLRYSIDPIKVYEGYIGNSFYRIHINHEVKNTFIAFNKGTVMDVLLVAELCAMCSDYCSAMKYEFKIGDYYEDRTSEPETTERADSGTQGDSSKTK